MEGCTRKIDEWICYSSPSSFKRSVHITIGVGAKTVLDAVTVWCPNDSLSGQTPKGFPGLT